MSKHNNTSHQQSITTGRVRRVCQDWQVLEDESFAHQLQNDEINEHYDRNRQNSRLVRDDFQAARREQLTEQQLLEYAHRQEVLEAEELAVQLAQLLDEEKHEEESQQRDEELARKIAQEEDELIAQEQQDRELARMLQAKERLKARRLREARKLAESRRQKEQSHHQTDGEGGDYCEEALNEALYANVGSTRLRNFSGAGRFSAHRLQSSDVDVNPTDGTGRHRAGSSLSGGIASPRSGSSTKDLSTTSETNRKPHTRKPAESRNEGAVPPYMPMQGLAKRTPPMTSPHSNASNGVSGYPAQESPKKNSPCKTQ